MLPLNIETNIKIIFRPWNFLSSHPLPACESASNEFLDMHSILGTACIGSYLEMPLTFGVGALSLFVAEIFAILQWCYSISWYAFSRKETSCYILDSCSSVLSFLRSPPHQLPFTRMWIRICNTQFRIQINKYLLYVLSNLGWTLTGDIC